ncbi:MAG TPA: hypothetical protein ENK18_02045 [Deltaproteobacteria bacterium]|nr:hypothetical protein [Deltaproteobacteria bacterium]
MSDDLDRLLALDRRALSERMAQGHPVEARAVIGHVYHGISLGLPRWVERCTWKTFCKVFHQDRHGPRGWNVATHQASDGLDWEPRVRGGELVTYGHFAIRPADPPLPARYGPPGLLLDYSVFAGPLDPMGLLRDPLVALRPDDPSLLLGVSVLALGSGVHTPTWFALLRAEPVHHVAEPLRPARGVEAAAAV